MPFTRSKTVTKTPQAAAQPTDAESPTEAASPTAEATCTAIAMCSATTVSTSEAAYTGTATNNTVADGPLSPSADSVTEEEAGAAQPALHRPSSANKYKLLAQLKVDEALHKVELAQLRVELAAARIAALRFEDEDDDHVASEVAPQHDTVRYDRPHHTTPTEGSVNISVPPSPQPHRTNNVDALRPSQPLIQSNEERVTSPTERNEAAGELAEHRRQQIAARAGQPTHFRQFTELPTYGYTKPEQVMKTMETRFGRPDAIALVELDRLRTLPRPTDAARDLCIFGTQVSNIVAKLRALDKVYLYNPEVTKVTIEKLTTAMRYRWYDFAAEHDSDEPDLLKLARFLQREVDRCSPYAQPESIIQTAGDARRDRYQQRLYMTTEKPIRNRLEKQKCPVCEKQGHKAVDCKTFIEADTDARWNIAKSKSLCFLCLNRRGKKHNCRSKPCKTDGCIRLHHSALHFERYAVQKTELVTAATPIESQCYLKMLPVLVSGPRGIVVIYALLNDGSTVTLIDAEIARQIGAEGRIDPLHIKAIAKNEIEASSSRRVSLTIYGETDSIKIQARTLNNLRLSPQRITEADMSGMAHIADITAQLRHDNATPRLVIGQDNWHLLLASEVRKGRQNEPVASRTPLGWVLHGAHTRGPP